MRAVKRYLSFYLEHMRLEEAVILPAAQRVLDEQDWTELDAAFATNCDPLTGKYPRDATYDRTWVQATCSGRTPSATDKVAQHKARNHSHSDCLQRVR